MRVELKKIGTVVTTVVLENEGFYGWSVKHGVKRILSVLMALSTFASGVLLTSLVDLVILPITVESTGIVMEPFPVSLQTQSNSATKLGLPDPVYTFPKSGIYFTTSEDRSGQSDFQFVLSFEETHLENDKKLIVKASALYENALKFSPVKVEIDGQFITLSTKSVDGIQFRFRGEFIERGYLESEYSRQIVLTGVLQKFKNGSKISESVSHFWYAVGC